MSLWLFAHARQNASAYMAVLLVAPLWAVWVLWLALLIGFTFREGLSVPLGPFLGMMVAAGIPFEKLCRWWRHLNFPISPQEGAHLSELLHARIGQAEWKVDPLLGPWRPCNRLERWMVLWAFEAGRVRDAVAARLRASSGEARGKASPRRL